MPGVKRHNRQLSIGTFTTIYRNVHDTTAVNSVYLFTSMEFEMTQNQNQGGQNQQGGQGGQHGGGQQKPDQQNQQPSQKPGQGGQQGGGQQGGQQNR